MSDETFQKLPDSTRETFLQNGLAKPEGIPIELADILIRIADTCGARGINLTEALRLKMAYNKTRPTRHGDKSL